MRPLIPLAALVLAAATACAVEPLPGPPTAPVVESLAEDGYESTASEISPDEELLCLPDGDRKACEELGELRWSVPLEGDYYLTSGYTLHLHGAGAPYGGRQNDPWAFHALATDSGLLYAENHLLHMVDPETGEILWHRDLKDEEGTGFLSDGLRGVSATEEHLLLNYVSGLVRVELEGEPVDHFEQDACFGQIQGATEDAVALDECGDDRHTWVFDPTTGERDHIAAQGMPEELDGTLIADNRFARSNQLSGDPFSRLDTDAGPGPEGLGTQELEETDTLRVGLACAPDGLEEASPEQPVPGVPCGEPRLYALNG